MTPLFDAMNQRLAEIPKGPPDTDALVEICATLVEIARVQQKRIEDLESSVQSSQAQKTGR